MTHFLKTQFLLCLAIFISNGLAKESVLTPEKLVAIRIISDVQISPDGRRVAFVSTRQRTPEEKPGSQWDEIWMMTSDGSDLHRAIFSEKSDNFPRWSPDGKMIAFLSSRPPLEKLELCVIPADGGEVRILANAQKGVKSLAWSPDGKGIAFVVEDAKSDEELKNEKMGKDWTIVEQNLKPLRLWVVDVASGEIHRISTTDVSVWDFDWSPDGKQIVIAATEKNLTDDSYMFVSLMTVSATAGEPTLVCKSEGKLLNPRWSPDGKWIAYRGGIAMNDPYAGSIFIVSASGGDKQNLTIGFKGSVSWIGWIPRSNELAFVSLEGTKNRLRSISASTKKISTLVDNGTIISGASLSADGKKLAFAGNSSKHPNEVWIGEMRKPPKRMTYFNPQLDSIVLGNQEVVRWTHHDGTEIEGVLVKPVAYQQGTRYPTVLQIHGGPESASTDGWNASPSNHAQLLAANGYAVLMPNYRGSIGRGVPFSLGDHKDLMGAEFEDILGGADFLIKLGIADSNRLGIIGASYGGYTSAWAATASDRFKAAVVFAGISNWYSMTGTSDIFWENSLVHWDAIMYENLELYWNRSPIAHINTAKTPTLIAQGTNDLRVPIGQGQELYRALLWKGVPVRLITYPREEHGLKEREHQLDYMKRVLAWFRLYLKIPGVQQ